jgi:hypothetical protein
MCMAHQRGRQGLGLYETYRYGKVNKDTPPEKVSTVIQGKFNDFLAH